jgi:hypothetical protein
MTIVTAVMASNPSVVAVAAPYSAFGPLIAGTSQSPNVIDTAILATFAINEYNRSFFPGTRLRATATGFADTWLEGVVTTWDGTNVTIDGDLSKGVGGYSNWEINVAGQPGQVGPQGPPGSTGAAGGAPSSSQYVVAASDVSLTGGRVLTNTATITWDFATAGQAKANSSVGGGNVSNAGTPTNGQFAQWTGATTVQGISAAAALSAIGAQPIDSDLTAIAALAGTNTIYYRSGAGAWSPVVIGANLTFTSGTLAASAAGGGGNVSNVGTPALNQFARWTAATTIEGISPATALAALGAPSLTTTNTFSGQNTFNAVSTFGQTATIAPPSASSTQGIIVNQNGSSSDSNGGLGTGWANSGYAYNQILIQSDRRADYGASPYTYGFQVYMGTGGTNARGSKYAIKGWTHREAADNTAQAYGDLGGIWGTCTSNAGDGGTNTGTGARGTLFAVSGQAVAGAGSTNLFLVSGGEIDVGIVTGASSRHRIGWSLVGTDNLQGAELDCALEIGAFPPAGQWRQGIVFSQIHGMFAIATNGTLIGCDGSPHTVLNGIDWSQLSFTNVAIATPGFSVSGQGDVASRFLRTGIQVLAGLPSAAAVGAGTRGFITDAASRVFDTVAVGGGANYMPVWSDGLNWRIG